jgi:hypothetical protein
MGVAKKFILLKLEEIFYTFDKEIESRPNGFRKGLPSDREKPKKKARRLFLR